MPRFPGDLRDLIDTELKLHEAPPFPAPVALHIIMQLAMGLKGLHEVGIYHRDIKSGNILVKKTKDLQSYEVYISDFESSEDIIGTGFYRALEVLQRLQGSVRGPEKLPELDWAADNVYSFRMTCYEILTGKVPMDGEKLSHYSKVLSDQRPVLPPVMVPDGLRDRDAGIQTKHCDQSLMRLYNF